MPRASGPSERALLDCIFFFYSPRPHWQIGEVEISQSIVGRRRFPPKTTRPHHSKTVGLHDNQLERKLKEKKNTHKIKTINTLPCHHPTVIFKDSSALWRNHCIYTQLNSSIHEIHRSNSGARKYGKPPSLPTGDADANASWPPRPRWTAWTASGNCVVACDFDRIE